MTTTDRDGITAAMYLRPSLDRDGRELAITRQRADLTKLCADKGWRAIEYADNNISATNGKHRAGLSADVGRY